MHTAYIGMGANLASWAGAPEDTLAAAALRLESLGRVVRRSSLYSTEPVGFAAQPRFTNAVVALQTELEPRQLLQRLLAIEKEFGRDRAAGFANGPRTLDLDILIFDGLTIKEPELEIPHPRLAERAFVLIPLHEIAPSAVDARNGKSVGQYLHSLFPNSGNLADALVKVQSDSWRASADRDVDYPVRSNAQSEVSITLTVEDSQRGGPGRSRPVSDCWQRRMLLGKTALDGRSETFMRCFRASCVWVLRAFEPNPVQVSSNAGIRLEPAAATEAMTVTAYRAPLSGTLESPVTLGCFPRRRLIRQHR